MQNEINLFQHIVVSQLIFFNLKKILTIMTFKLFPPKLPDLFVSIRFPKKIAF